MTEITEDAFFEGQIRIRQHREGYRFSIDAVILAHHAAGSHGSGFSRKNGDKGRHILDLGTGCGIIPLIVAFRRPMDRFTAVEVQEELACLARINVADNGLSERISILHRDLKTLKAGSMGAPIDLVVSNPPYRPAGSGRMNVHPERAVARHEIRAAVSDVARAASRMMEISGRFAVIFPAERLTTLLSEMTAAGIAPKFLRMIHSRRESAAKLVLVEGIKGGRPGLAVDPALIIYRPDGTYTDEAAAMFRP